MNVNESQTNMPAATTSATDPLPNPAGFNGHNELSSAQASQMGGWVKEDLAKGKITQAQADQAFEQLGISVEHRASQPDQGSAEHQQLDQDLPAARPEEYLLHYHRPGQEPSATAEQSQQLKQFDQSARTWLSQAGFAREHGNSLATAIGRVIEKTHGMSESQLEAYGQAEFAKLESIYGSELENKLQSAAKMVHELEGKQPGLKALLKNRGIGDAAPVVALLVQQAERYHVRNRR